MESTQVLECTQVLDSCGIEERIETPVKVATLTIDGTDYTIWNRENKIGRDAKCNIVLNSKAVSVEHVVIEADLHGGHFICDLGSTNKTKLGEVQLKPWVKYFIKDGDSLKLANLKGVYHHVKMATDMNPAEYSTPPITESTKIPETPERKEDDVIASIVTETPYKDEGNGADSSDGDIFGEAPDSSALFVRPLKLPSVDTKSPDEKSVSERFGDLLDDPMKEASIYAAASQSVTSDSIDTKGDKRIDDSSVCNADSSDLVAGSQPLFSPDKHFHDSKIFDCDTEPPVRFEDELTQPPQGCNQWENIDDSIDAISNCMDSIDSMVQKNEVQVTYTPPKRKPDSYDPKTSDSDIVQRAASTSENEPEEALKGCNEWENIEDSINEISQKMDTLDSMVEKNELIVTNTPLKNKTDTDDLEEVGSSSKHNILGNSLEATESNDKSESPSSSSSSLNKLVEKRIVRNLEEELDVRECKDDNVDICNSRSVLNSKETILPENSKKTVYDLATQEIPENIPDEDMAGGAANDSPGGAVDDSSVDESTDLVQGSQSMVTNGEDNNIFDVDTVPVGYDVNDQSSSKLNIFDMATQQVQSEGVAEVYESRDDPECKSRAVLDSKVKEDIREEQREENCDPTAEVIDQEIAEMSISDLPTQAIPNLERPACDKSVNLKLIENCDVSISDMATQVVSAVETNCQVSSVHQASISNMPTEEVEKNQSEERTLKLDKIVGNPCDISISDMATQQVSFQHNVQDDVVSELPVGTSSECTIQPKEVANEIKNADSEEIYNVMTQLPIGSSHIVCEEPDTQLINADAQKASHSKSMSVTSTAPNEVESADISLSDLPTQVAVLVNDETPAKTLEPNNEILMSTDTEDFFDAMTQRPVDKDETPLKALDTQRLNSEVEMATLDASLSEMMTQPAKSSSGVIRESPIADISELPTQTTPAKSDGMARQDSEDIYDVMTQIPLQNQKHLPDDSNTQQLNTNFDNSELEMDGQVSNDRNSETSTPVSSIPFKTVDPLEELKNDESKFKVPALKRNLGRIETEKGEDVDVCMMDTQTVELHASHLSTPTGDSGTNDGSTTKCVSPVVSQRTDSGLDLNVSAIETGEAKDTLPTDPMIDKDADGDIFEVDTVPIPDATQNVTPNGSSSSKHSLPSEDGTAAKDCENETGIIDGEHSPVHSTHETDPSSVEGRIRAMSDKNVNSFATQQILVSSNTRSTVAELLETLEDTSSQVVRVNKKVKKLEYSDSEGSNSPVLRVERHFKTLVDSDNEGSIGSPLLGPKKHCLPLVDTQEEIESDQGKVINHSNDPEAELEILCNGNGRHRDKSSQDSSYNMPDSPLGSPKVKIADLMKDDIPLSDETKKDALDGDKCSGSSNGVLKDSDHVKVDDVNVTSGAKEYTESCNAPSSKVPENLSHQEEEENCIGNATVNITGESDLLQLRLSADEAANKLNASVPKPTVDNFVENDSLQLNVSVDTSLKHPVSAPGTPEKSDAAGVTNVTPSTRTLNVITKPSPETPEIPKDFFGSPVFHDKPVRQYVNRKKLSLSSTSLLKAPNAFSTPKSEVDSCSIIEMGEPLQSAIKPHKVDEKQNEQKSIDVDCSTPKNRKKFKKASPQKRNSSEIVEQHSQEIELLSQESFDSQDFGRGKRKKMKKSFFDDSKDVDSFNIKFRTALESQEIKQSHPQTSSSLRSAATRFPANEEHLSAGEKPGRENSSNDKTSIEPQSMISETISCDDSSKSKKIKLSAEVKIDLPQSSKDKTCDMDLTCVSNRLQDDVEVMSINVRRASLRKPDPASLKVIPNNESVVETVKPNETVNNTRGRNKDKGTSELDSEKDIQSLTKTADSSKPSTAGVATSTSPTKSLRGRKRNDITEDTKSDSDSVACDQRAKRNKTEDTVRGSQKTPDRMEESNNSLEISIKSMSKRLQGALKNNLKLEEGKIDQKLNQRRNNPRNSDVGDIHVSKDVFEGKGNVGKGTADIDSSDSAVKLASRRCALIEDTVHAASNPQEETSTSQVPSLKVEVKRKGRPRKVGNQKEQTLQKDDISKVPDPEPTVSHTSVPVRRGRRKLVLANEKSAAVTDTSEIEPPVSPQVSAPKRGRPAKIVDVDSTPKEAVDNKSVVSEFSDSQNAPSTSKSKTRGRGRITPAIVEDSLVLETEQDSQLENLSQGRRSMRSRKKKESFDDIMSRKEDELKMKKQLRNSQLSQSSGKSRSVSRSSIASSCQTEDNVAATSTTRGRGRPKKSDSLASTSTASLIGDDSAFSVPASVPSSPAGSNSSRRKNPRPGSASSSRSADSQPSTKKKQQGQAPTSSSQMKVMFTGLADAKLSSMVKKLGGKVVEKPADCSVLVTDKVRRTVKLLCALALGKPIVSPNWLSKSKAFNKFTDPYDSILNDSEAEGRFDFELKASLESAQNSRLLEGYSFYTTPSVMPPPAEIKPIVECSGGTFLAKPPAKWAANAAILSSPKDKSDWAKLTKHGVLPPILSAEALLSGVLQQRFDLGKHRLK